MTANVKTMAMGLIVVACLAGCYETTTVGGSDGKKLTVTKPSSVTIKQGTTEQVKISITREKFTGPVDIRFDKLPAGVTVQETKMQIPASDNSVTFTLKADDNAAIVTNHDGEVTVSAPGGLTDRGTLPITVIKRN